MYQALQDIIDASQFSVIESFEVPGRSPALAPVPTSLKGGQIGQFLQQLVGAHGGLWRHQAEAISIALDGQNIVVSTSTASGKSLIFRSVAFHHVLNDPACRVVVFYPLKALASDQYTEWRRWGQALAGDENVVGRIDGSIPMRERTAILNRARIVLMTPDVCHAWLMSNLADPQVKQFVRSLTLVVLDEAHTLEGVFGSNFSYLIRRLNAARSVVWHGAKKTPPLQFVATTATILNAPGHLEQLTGLNFVEIGNELDGSPEHLRRVLHVASPKGEEVSITRQLQVELLKHSRQGAFITFVDSRKGVELLAYATNAAVEKLMPGKGVLPYRAGLAAEDREAIEVALRGGSLKGVVATSALELGIDLPQLCVGLNVGVPATRKAFRQRLGRVGRAGPGAFVVVAPPHEFTRFGMTLREYYDRSVEPSYLYLSNRFMQFAHARCLSDELESLGAKDGAKVPLKTSWPEGFEDIYGYASPGARRPREFDAVAMLGGDTPQRSYPLRNVGEINFKIKYGGGPESLGEATLPQALRECYPGATYFYMARPYKVNAWRASGFEPQILVSAAGNPAVTKPRIQTWVNATVDSAGVVDRHLKTSAAGFLAECEMQITERVQGYEEGGTYRSYDELRATNPNMKPKMRQFRTTGVLLCIKAPWFRAPAVKARLADDLLELFCREHSVLSQDVDCASSNISVRTTDGEGKRGDCIAIYDQTYGSLRLTERLYLEFNTMIERLRAGAGAGGGAPDPEWQAFLEQLADSTAEFIEEETALERGLVLEGDVPGGLMRVYATGSRLGYREKGHLHDEVEIIAPGGVQPDGTLMYQVRFYPRNMPKSPVKRWVSSSYLEPLGDQDDWSYTLWNPETGEYVEEAAEEEAGSSGS